MSDRVALVHDWFQGYHGSERVADAIRVLFEQEGRGVDVWTFHAVRELVPPDLAGAIVHESAVARLPGLRQRQHRGGRWRYLLPYMPIYFRRLDLSDYRLVISSSHACASHVRSRRGAAHIVYCHTPMRYAWLPELDRRARGARRLAVRLASGWLRHVDLEASRRPDSYVANSEAVRRRIARFYGRDARVIHPPVEVDEFDATRPKEPGRFLWVHRLVPYKRPEVVVEAFAGLPFRLTMVGRGPLERRLLSMLPANIELRGWVPRAELTDLFARSSGFIHVAEEDFGITMVEALAAGMPVVALDAGGARDIVRPGIDGELLQEADVESIRAGVREVAARDWDAAALSARAREFSAARFMERFSAHVSEVERARLVAAARS